MPGVRDREEIQEPDEVKLARKVIAELSNKDGRDAYTARRNKDFSAVRGLQIVVNNDRVSESDAFLAIQRKLTNGMVPLEITSVLNTYENNMMRPYTWAYMLAVAEERVRIWTEKKQ